MKFSLFLFLLGFVSFSKARPQPLQDLFGGIVSGFTDKVSQLGSGLTDKLSDVGGNLTRTVTQVGSNITSRVSQGGLIGIPERTAQVGGSFQRLGGNLFGGKKSTPLEDKTTASPLVEDDQPTTNANCNEFSADPLCKGLLAAPPRKCPAGERLQNGECYKIADI